MTQIERSIAKGYKGIYAKFFTKGSFDYRGKPALFIDRDGVLVEEVNFLCRKEDVIFIPGAIEAILEFNQANIPVVMVTNQSGIGRGYFGWERFEEVQEEIITALNKKKAFLDAVLACPYHKEGVEGYRIARHPFRKPNPGMILFAAKVMGIDLKGSWMIGDRLSDVETALNAGLKGAVHVETGYGKEERKKIENLPELSLEILFTESLSTIKDYLRRRMEDKIKLRKWPLM